MSFIRATNSSMPNLVGLGLLVGGGASALSVMVGGNPILNFPAVAADTLYMNQESTRIRRGKQSRKHTRRVFWINPVKVAQLVTPTPTN